MSSDHNVDPEILMPDTISSSSLRRNWLPALIPVWDSAAEPLIVHAGRPMVCGSSSGSDLRISLSGVAERHCELEFRRGVLAVVQTWAAVWVNDVPVRAGATIALGDRVAVGSATFRVEQLVQESGTADFLTMPSGFHAAAFAGRENNEDQDPQEERLQQWHDGLQKRSDDLSLQAKRLDDRFNQLLKSQAEYEHRAHKLEESHEALRTERISAEADRAQLQADQDRIQRLTNELDHSQQAHDQRESEQTSRSENLQAQSDSLASKSKDLTQQARLLESQHAECEEQRIAQEDAAEQTREQIASEEAALLGQQLQLQEKISESQNVLGTVQQRQQEQEAEWTKRQAKIDKQDHNLQEQLGRHQQDLQDLAEQQATSESRNTELLEREQQVQSAEESLQQRIAESAEREESLRTAFEQQELAAEALAQQQTQQDEHNNSLASRESAADNRNQELNQLAESIEATDHELIQRALVVEAEQQAFEQHEAAVSVQEQAFQAQLDNRESEFTAEIESQQQVFAAERQKLQEWEAELRNRHDETAERVLAFKRARAETRLQASEEQSINIQMDELTSLLTEANVRLQESVDSNMEVESRASGLQSERDALTQSLQEMQDHADLLQSKLTEQDESNTLQRQEERFVELTNELALHEIQKEQSGKEVDELRVQLTAFESTVDTQHGQEEQLLRQIEDLRAEISAAGASSENDHDAMVAQSTEQDSLIRELTEQLQASEQALNELQIVESGAEAQANEAVQQLAERDAVIAELREHLQLAKATSAESVPETEQQDNSGWQQEREERDGLIRELQEQLVASQSVINAEASGGSDEEVRIRSRELDNRTVVLDRRDDELGERNHRLQNTEEELETERRQLQDARQQLELARAEIQVSMGYATPESVVAPLPVAEAESELIEAVESPVQEESVTDLRSELASLFGMGADSEAETPVEDLVDVGTAGGDSIVLSFQDTQGVLLETQPEEAEGQDSDYVTRYMEQLLERSRTSAGESLPEEFNKVEAAPPQPAKSTSFIDQHAQSNPDEFSETGGEVSASGGADAALLDAPSPARQKIDLEALRQDMDSFRQVSARSVQKALESHAMQTERNGMAGRQAVTAVLALMTVFVAVANVMGLIAFPKLVWGLTAASALAAGELFRRMYVIKSRLREMTEHVGASPDTTAAPAEQPDVVAEVVEPVGDDFIGSVAEEVTETEAVVSEAIIPEERPVAGEEVASEPTPATVLGATDEEEKYYEL